MALQRFRFVLPVLPVLMLALAPACSASPNRISPTSAASPLRLERKIALPDVKGRIDHLAVDDARYLLFVAEYSNGSVDEVDLAAGKPTARISALHEPQGLAVTTDGKQLVVACGDGSVRFYAMPNLKPLAQLDLGDDADDVRIDSRQGHVVVGYGGGGLAVIDPEAHKVIGRLTLPAHPEGFELQGSRVIVNVPNRGEIIAGDLDKEQVTATWATGSRRLNFPMAIDQSGKWFATAYRFPATLEIRDIASGTIIAHHAACGDADDVFINGDRLFLVCGAGHVDVVDARHPNDDQTRVDTSGGARTGLFVPAQKTLFVAAPKRSGVSATIWELRVD